jgi:hypothetical protein
MTGSLSHSLASAPVEEEEVTPETAAALDRARASLARGEAFPTKTCCASSAWVNDRRASVRTNRLPNGYRRTSLLHLRLSQDGLTFGANARPRFCLQSKYAGCLHGWTGRSVRQR